MNRRIQKIWMLMLLVALLLLSGCTVPSETAPTGSSQETQFLKLSTLAPGTSINLVMTTFATIVNEEIPNVEIQVNSTGPATQHALQGAKGEIDFFLAAPVFQTLMDGGLAMYAEVPEAPEVAGNMRAIFNFPVGIFHIIVDADSGIEDFEDFKGKRVFLGPPGGSALRDGKMMMAAVGLDPETDFELVELGWGPAAQAFQDKQIDVWSVPTLVGSPGVTQVALTRDLRILGFTEEHFADEGMQEFLSAHYNYRDVIPAGAYGDSVVNTEDVHSLGAMVGVGTNVNVDADLVYEITKAFWEGVDAQRETTPWMENVILEDALDAMITPLHAGTLRYYQEIGLEVPEELIPEEAK